MSNFEDLSREGVARDELGPQSVRMAPPAKGIIGPAELDDLREHVGEARVRTKELVALYVATSARANAALARHREATAAQEEARTALSSCVARYAALLRALGEPPERTLVLIKSAFNEAAPRQDDDHRAALEDVVKWIVEAYYAA